MPGPRCRCQCYRLTHLPSSTHSKRPQSRPVSTTVHYNPVFYRDSIRTQRADRQFPLWLKKQVPRTVGAETGPVSSIPGFKTRRPAKSDRLPGWEGLWNVLDGTDIDVAERRSERRAKRLARLHALGLAEADPIFQQIDASFQHIRTLASDEQVDAVYALYISTIEPFTRIETPHYHLANLPAALAKLIKGCAQSDRIDLAEMVLGQYIKDMPLFLDTAVANEEQNAAKVFHSPYPFNALIAAYGRRGSRYIKRIIGILEEMQRHNITPNTHTYSLILKSLTPEHIRHAKAIFDALLATSKHISLATLNAALDLSLRAGPAHQQFTMKIFETIQKLYPVNPQNPHSGPNAGSVSILLSHCKSEENMRNVAKDAETWGVFDHPQVQADLLRACLRIHSDSTSTKKANPSIALSRILDWANRYATRNVPLSPEAVGLILQAFGKAGAVLGGLSFVDRIQRDGKVRISRSMPLLDLLRALERRAERGVVSSGDERVAMRAWEEVMGVPGVDARPPGRTIAAIVNAMGKIGDTRGVWRLYRSMTKDKQTLDPIVARAFVRAFGAKLASDPRAAAAVFSASLSGKGEASEKLVLNLLSGIRDRRDAAKTLDTLISLLVARNLPIASNTLVKAFARVVDEARDEDLPPMAFSSGEELQKVGAWPELTPATKTLIDATRIAVVKATAKGVAGAAQEVRDGKDVEGALGALEQLLGDARTEKDGVADALAKLEALARNDKARS
ncbi:hypothetical protein HDV00_012054 [Rhizophlyctis rosea]|nr:hypothetical protein HDV00_012054 [Rhizophlyctis rosea]